MAKRVTVLIDVPYNPFPGLPAPVHLDARISFTLLYYDTPEVPARAAEATRVAGNTYNGGWFHGEPCGRETQFDHVPAGGPNKGKRLYAVSC